MQLRQLEYFVAVVDAGSITAAASRLLVAQPSISEQIKLLERELGARLLERAPRGMRLTPAGRTFLEDARVTMDSLSRATRRVRQVEAGEGGELHVGTVRSLSFSLLPESIATWHRSRSNVVMRLREFVHKDELENAIRSGYGDVAIGPEPRRRFEYQVDVGDEEFVVVLPVGDPLADRPAIDIYELRTRLWVLFAADHGLSEITAQACRDAGFIPEGAVHTYQVEAAVRLAAAGLGPTLVPRNTIPVGLDAAVLPLHVPITRTLCVYSRDALSPLARSYVEALRDSVARREYL